MTSLLIRGSLGQITANHELVDISEETTAWDLLHLTSAPPMMPTASPRRQKKLATGNQAAHPSGRLLPHNTAHPPTSASPPRTRGAGQARTWILADEGRHEGRCEADEWKRRAARMWPGAADGGGCRRYRSNVLARSGGQAGVKHWEHFYQTGQLHTGAACQ